MRAKREVSRPAAGPPRSRGDEGLEAIVTGAVIPKNSERLGWDYDGDADVLSVSIGRPRKATGVDIGQGVIVRYDEKKRQVVGLTAIGMRARLVELLSKG